MILGWVADSFAVWDKLGFLYLPAFVILVFGIAILVEQRKLQSAERSRAAWRLGWVAALTAPAVMLVTFVVADTGKPPPPPQAMAPAAPASSATVQPAPSPEPARGTTVSAGLGCPLPDPSDPALPSVDVNVVYWCKSEVYTKKGAIDPDHIQIKLRPRLVNNTPDPISIAIGKPSAVRLLVTGKQIDKRWSPPPLTKANGDRPILVVCDGQTYWAIPPNVPRDATATSSGYYTGYVTSWDGKKLPPGGSYWKPLRKGSGGRVIREGNLVFQVPTDSNGEAVVFGLAVIDPKRGNAVLGLARADDPARWGPPLSPMDF